MKDTNLRLYAAPIQGYTEAEWRHYHAHVAGGADAYYTPFIRFEKGSVRNKDMREINSTFNTGLHIIPQILIRDINEMRSLTDAIIQAGYSETDLNMGCPFAPQVKHGRGAALLTNPDLLHAIGCEMKERYPHIRFSAKMRLGISDPTQWRNVIREINDMPLTDLTVHPRTAIQQYGGDLYMDEFATLLQESKHPIIYNGNITTPADIDHIVQTLPKVHGVMVGRGLLSRPTLFTEWRTTHELPPSQQLPVILRLHDAIYDVFKERLCGDTQILSKIKPYWDYLEESIGHKTAKAIRKSTSLAKYEAAVATIR